MADPHLEGEALLSAMAAASGVFYNHSQELKCFDYKVGPNKESDEDEQLFSYQVQIRYLCVVPSGMTSSSCPGA